MHKDPEKRKEYLKNYQRKWMSGRRKNFLKGKTCKCGATEGLQLLKKNESDGLAKSHIWSYKESQREKALQRYDIACATCARRVKNERLRRMHLGKPGTPLFLNHSDVWAIRGRLLGKETLRQIGRAYGIQHQTVSDIQTGKAWGWLKPGSRRVKNVNS